jgi:hypothetical protein
MTQIFKENTKGYKVLTPNGFQPFAGVSMMGTKPIVRMEFEQGAFVECTHDHKFYVDLYNYKQARDIAVGDTVFSSLGDITLLNKIELGHSEPVYDLIEVAAGHRYFTNKILSSNCEFLVFEETLINSIKLAEMNGAAPLFNIGQSRWYKKPTSQYTYCVALDPSMGTGGNNAAIQVFELPSYEQVAEWSHNTTPIPGQIRVLSDICRYIADVTHNPSGVYWSVENNGLGEAALLVINDFGEENIPGVFISEPIRKGHVRKFRKGFNTTHGSKVAANSRLKTMIESDKMKVNSKPLVSELKNYIAMGASYKAKSGQTDDLISATLLVLRMIDILKDWDPRIYETFTQADHYDDYEPPLPIFVSANY